MEKFLEQFAKVPLQQKIAAAALAVVMIAVGTWFLSVSEAIDTIAGLDEQIGTQETKLVELEQKAQHRTQFLREVERLKQHLHKAEEQLPKQAEIPKVLRDIDYEAKQAGLRVDRFQPEAEAQQGDFAAVPLKMTVRGNYHEIAVFLDRLSKMPRIVNVTDLNMTVPTLENKKIVVASSYTATTYRFLERDEIKPAAGVTAGDAADADALKVKD
jgi:type IV pilus assembly protein PilO